MNSTAIKTIGTLAVAGLLSTSTAFAVSATHTTKAQINAGVGSNSTLSDRQVQCLQDIADYQDQIDALDGLIAQVEGQVAGIEDAMSRATNRRAYSALAQMRESRLNFLAELMRQHDSLSESLQDAVDCANHGSGFQPHEQEDTGR